MGLTGNFGIYKIFILLYVLFMVDAARRDYARRIIGECAGGTGIYYSVYHIESGRYIYSICYSNEMGITLFTHHYIDRTVPNLPRGSLRLSFSSNGIPEQLLEESRDPYNKTIVKEKFRHLRNVYFSNSFYLARGHLVPDADFRSIDYEATYSLLNAVPQWQAINAGNWKSLEDQIRGQVQHLGTKFSVYTGTLDTLAFPDQNNNEVQMYLAGNNLLPVPKYIWKVVQDLRTNETITFVVYNNPFVQNPEMPCTDVCDKHNWAHTNWKISTSGYLICCKILEFTQKISNLNNQVSPNSPVFDKKFIKKEVTSVPPNKD